MIEISVDVSGEAASRTQETALACLRAHARKVGGVPSDPRSLSVLALDKGRTIGGMIGKILWNWLYADLVWVEEEYRGQGIGARVMRAAEARARQMKLTGIYLWTQSWQAPGFYKKLGYTQYIEFQDFPPGHSRLGFRKYLV